MTIGGVFGFYHNDKIYIIYNSAESSPTLLGNKLISELRLAVDQGLMKDVENAISNLRIVTEHFKPSPDDVKYCKKLSIWNSDENPESWYQLLSSCQGSFRKVLESGYCLTYGNNCIEYPEEFDCDSYGYIFNLENKTLDVFDKENMIQMDLKALCHFTSDDLTVH